MSKIESFKHKFSVLDACEGLDYAMAMDKKTFKFINYDTTTPIRIFKVLL